MLLIPYFVAFLKGDDDELARSAAVARKSPAMEDTISHLEALALARSGQLRDARRTSAVAVEIAQRAGRGERAGLFEAGRAVWEAFYGNAAAARQSAGKALALGRGRDVDYAAAFALALSGDLPQSRALAEDLAREFPEDTFVQFMYLPTLRALFSLNARRSGGGDSGAADRLALRSRAWAASASSDASAACIPSTFADWRTSQPVNPPKPPPSSSGFSIIAGIVLVDPMDALARLQLARALALSGDTVKAKSAYSDLLTLWKNADPDIPVLKQARAEFARLP